MNLEKFYNEEFSSATSKLVLKSKTEFNNKALFLDRDGVLIKDVHHINNPERVELCPFVVSFLKKARLKGYDFIVITNQSSVSRSIITYSQYKNITARFLSFLPQDLYPEMILSSFHLPNNENNLRDFNWRKPGTGMIDYALRIRKYKKSESIIIGDKITDLIAGHKSGLSKIIHLKSELHKNQLSIIKKWEEINNIKFAKLKSLEVFSI